APGGDVARHGLRDQPDELRPVAPAHQRAHRADRQVLHLRLDPQGDPGLPLLHQELPPHHRPLLRGGGDRAPGQGGARASGCPEGDRPGRLTLCCGGSHGRVKNSGENQEAEPRRGPSGGLPITSRPMSTKLRLGEVEIVRMGLGTNRLTNTPRNIAFVKEAVAAGVGMIDTAHSYTGGQSEETIGAALAADPRGCVVATKGGIGRPGHGRPEMLHAEIEESFRRLRTDSVPLYYLHRVDPETPLE